MKVFRFYKRIIFFVAIVNCIANWQVSAQQVLILSESDAKTTKFGAFNSYQHKLLLISLEQTGKGAFECLPNKYLFYDFGNEDYFELDAGNLKVDNSYSKIFRTRIHSLGGMSKKNKSEWEKRIKQLLQTLNVSAQTLENGKMVSSDGGVICWQQPEALDIKGGSIKTFPYLASNLCDNHWCSELYWTDNHHIRFWVQIDPKKFHLMRLNVDNEKTEFTKNGPKFKVKDLEQANAPRDNLVTSSNIQGKSITLNSRNGADIKLSWKMLKNGHIRIILLRSKADESAAKNMKSKIERIIEQRRIPEALQQIRFALWLDPGNQAVKMQRLQAYAALLMVDKLFESLKTDFSGSHRFSACQKLHIDKPFRHLWKRNDFLQKFKEHCS